MRHRAQNNSCSQRYWKLVDSGEPFRLLFPLGALLGIVGVAIWPLYFWGLAPVYPGQIHARIMIECFLTAFVMGFLGTAFPRLLDVRRLGLTVSIPLAVALLACASLHVTGHILWGDITYFATLATFLGVLLSRARKRKDFPPPSFVLVAMGMLSGLIGAGILITDRIWPMFLAPWTGSMGRILLHQGYPLLPIMGVGAFLLPRFFGLPSRQNFPESRGIPPGWWPHALVAMLAGGLIVASFILEAQGWIRSSYALRLAALAGYFVREMPPHKVLRGRGTLALGLKVALFSIPVGYLMLAIGPEHYFAWLHTVFIPGFSLLILIVACRVVFGHGGQSKKFLARLWVVLSVIFLLGLAAATRISADWMPERRLSHYAYAAITWVVGILVWFAAVRVALFRKDDDPD